MWNNSNGKSKGNFTTDYLILYAAIYDYVYVLLLLMTYIGIFPLS